MSANALPTPIATPDESLTPLARVLDECAAKIAADVIRFRACAADPRASK
jgi:hypothetical protein